MSIPGLHVSYFLTIATNLIVLTSGCDLEGITGMFDFKGTPDMGTMFKGLSMEKQQSSSTGCLSQFGGGFMANCMTSIIRKKLEECDNEVLREQIDSITGCLGFGGGLNLWSQSPTSGIFGKKRRKRQQWTLKRPDGTVYDINRHKRQLPDLGSTLGGSSRPSGNFNSGKGVGTSIDNAVDPLNLRGAVGIKGVGETVGQGVDGASGSGNGNGNNGNRGGGNNGRGVGNNGRGPVNSGNGNNGRFTNTAGRGVQSSRIGNSLGNNFGNNFGNILGNNNGGSQIRNFAKPSSKDEGGCNAGNIAQRQCQLAAAKQKCLDMRSMIENENCNICQLITLAMKGDDVENCACSNIGGGISDKAIQDNVGRCAGSLVGQGVTKSILGKQLGALGGGGSGGFLQGC